MKISGKFEVKLESRDLSISSDRLQLGRRSFEKTFIGELEATSCGEMLSAMDDPFSFAGYVALEEICGSLGGKKGSFIMLHLGTRHGTDSHLQLQVVPGSGTGELSGLTGTMQIRIEQGQHFYDFEFTL